MTTSSATSQSPSCSADIRSSDCLRRGGRPGRAAVHAHAATSADVEGAVRPGCRAAGAFGQGGRPAGDRHGPQQIGVEDQLAGAAPVGHRPQRADGEPVQGGSRGVFLPGQPLGGLQDRAGAGVAAVVADDVGGEGIDGDHLGDDVQIAAGVQLDVDVRERFEPGAELAAGTPNPLGDRADQAVVAGQEGDDAVGLTELVLAQHDRPVPVQPHQHEFPTAMRHPRGTRAVSLDVAMTVNVNPSRSTRFPTLGEQLYQLASGAVTSGELVRRSLHAITVSQSTLNAFRLVLTEDALADAAEADRRRAAGDTAPLLGIPIAVKDDVDIAGVPDLVRHRRPHPAGDRGLRGGAPVAGRRRGHRRQDQLLRAGPVAVHQRTGVRAHPQPVVAQAHPGRVVGRQRRRGRRRTGGRGHRLRRRGQHPGSRGVDAPGRHQAAARPHLHLRRCAIRSTASRSTVCWPAPSTDAALVLDACAGNVDGRSATSRRRCGCPTHVGVAPGTAADRGVDCGFRSPCSAPSCIPRSARRCRPSPSS